MSGQLDFLDVLVPPRPHRWPTLDDIEERARAAAAAALEQHQLGPAYIERATTMAFSAMILFGAARVLEQRRHTNVKGTWA